jgi:SOS response regulatory protein OraA/RecX
MESPSAVKQKLMDFLSQKSYSQQELFQKLIKHFSAQEIEEACTWASELQLIEDPKKMAERYAQELSAKGKGPNYIHAALLKKGLPVVGSNTETEVECARVALQKKFRQSGPLSPQFGRRAIQFLIQRGFNQETIRQAVGIISDENDDPFPDS